MIILGYLRLFGDMYKYLGSFGISEDIWDIWEI